MTGAPRERGRTCARCARRADHTRRTHAFIAFVTCAFALRSAVEYAAAADGVFTMLSDLKSAVGACTTSAPCTHGAVPIENWDVGAIDNMQGLFYAASAFNQDISAWNTASVTNMARMFNYAAAFNQDISAWNTTSVTHMSYMFN